MRLAFMGSPGFAVPALESLLACGHEIAMIYAAPVPPADRGARLPGSAVAKLARERGLPLATPARLRHNESEWQRFAALSLDCAVVAAYGLILPEPMLRAPKRGALNIHASLLPRWRGAAPIAAAILAGDAKTGVTIMQMDAGLDTGAILLQESVNIPPDATSGGLTATLGEVGARLIRRALEENPEPRPQPSAGATYASRLSRADGRLDWRLAASALARKVRAFAPWPGTFCEIEGCRLKVLEAVALPAPGAPGILLDAEFTVACADGALRLLSVQPAGGKPMSGAAYLRGHRFSPGGSLA